MREPRTIEAKSKTGKLNTITSLTSNLFKIETKGEIDRAKKKNTYYSYIYLLSCKVNVKYEIEDEVLLFIRIDCLYKTTNFFKSITM